MFRYPCDCSLTTFIYQFKIIKDGEERSVGGASSSHDGMFKPLFVWLTMYSLVANRKQIVNHFAVCKQFVPVHQFIFHVFMKNTKQLTIFQCNHILKRMPVLCFKQPMAVLSFLSPPASCHHPVPGNLSYK